MNSNKFVLLKDVEEMIKKMIGKNQFGDIDYSEDYCNSLNELLNSLSSLPTQNEWITLDVSEDSALWSYSEFIGLDKNLNPSIGWMNDTPIKYYGYDKFGDKVGEITHWMPLHLPPTN